MNITLKDFPIYTLDAQGEEIETLYTINCDLTPYDPGRTYGPPEKCYPPEGGECEICDVTRDGKEIPAKEWAALGIDEEKIAEAAWEKAPSKDDDDDPRGWEPGGDR